MRLLARLRQTPVVRRSDIWWTLVPALLWWGVFELRPYISRYECARTPTTCVAENVPRWDRLALTQDDKRARKLSDVAQDASGGVFVVTALGIQLGRMVLGATPAGAWAALGTDIVIALQAALWNSFTNSVVRVTAQRARPFVYRNPSEAGKNAMYYTSFYSGHTSFAAVMWMSLVLMLAGRGAPAWIWLTFSGLGLVFVATTAVTRVLAGWHFPSDVVVGACMGIFFAFWSASRHRKV